MVNWIYHLVFFIVNVGCYLHSAIRIQNIPCENFIYFLHFWGKKKLFCFIIYNFIFFYILFVSCFHHYVVKISSNPCRCHFRITNRTILSCHRTETKLVKLFRLHDFYSLKRLSSCLYVYLCNLMLHYPELR